MDVAGLLAEWYDDPVRFANDIFEQHPREVQPEIMRAVGKGRWTAVAACRDLGKSRLAAYVALWFLVTRPRSLVFTCAPVWDQVEQALWAEIRGIYTDSKLPKLKPTWELQNAAIKTDHPLWRAIGVTSKEVENIEGRHADHVLVILDESKGISDEFFSSVQGMLSQPTSKLLAIGTPGVPSGWFARAFGVDRELWNSHFQVSSATIPRLAPHYWAERKRLGPNNPWFLQQQEAKFAGADEATVIPQDTVMEAVERKYDIKDQRQTMRWPRILSLDPAAKGSDDSVLTFRWGPVILKQQVWNGQDEMWTANKTADEAVQFKAHTVIIDEIGLGAGIRSRVRQLLRPTPIQVYGFHGGKPARDTERFINTKAEMVFRLKDRFQRGEIQIPNDPKLISQLCGWTMEFTASGKTKIVDPADSPDQADSLMLAFCADNVGQGFKFQKVGWL